MNGFVADSSVAIAWTVPSQSSTATDRLLDEVTTGTPFAVPVLWVFEVANTLIMLRRRKRLEPEECASAREILKRLAPLIDDQGYGLAFRKISELAEEYSLSVYDATYLELAIRRGLPLASRDAALNDAAKRSGVSVLF